MRETNILENIWGCRISEYEFDIARHAVCLTVSCLGPPSGPNSYRIEMREVLSFGYTEDPNVVGRAYLSEPWDFIDLSTIVANRVKLGGDEYWKVEAEIWIGELEVICGELEVTSLALNGGDNPRAGTS